MNELVDRTLLIGFEEPEPPEWLLRAAPRVGGVVLYGQNLCREGDATRHATRLRAAGDVLVAVDEEGGDVTRLHYGTGSPAPGNYALGTADDPALTAAVAARIGAELRAAGIRWDLAPVVDVNANPTNPVIGVRSFGAEPDLVSRHTSAWVRGLQGQGVAGCAKHFPGHGDTALDSHLALPVVHCPEEEWRRVHRPPFAAAVAAGVQSVMTAHVQVPALDSRPATLSRRILTDLLRDELGFGGVVVTDALDMGGMAAYGPAAAAVAALAAGADALCLGSVGGEAIYRSVRDAVVAAVRSGDLPRPRLEEAAERVERLRAWLAVAPTDPVPDGEPELVAARHAAVAHRVVPLHSRPVLVELRAAPNLAVGQAAWDLSGPLTAAGLAPLRTVAADGDESVADGHPLVVVGRDVARVAWQAAVWDRIRRRRPDAVLVDLGLPRPEAFGDVPYVLAGGAARPNLRAAVELLISGG